jgi:hypothetical protein
VFVGLLLGWSLRLGPQGVVLVPVSALLVFAVVETTIIARRDHDGLGLRAKNAQGSIWSPTASLRWSATSSRTLTTFAIHTSRPERGLAHRSPARHLGHQRLRSVTRCRSRLRAEARRRGQRPDLHAQPEPHSRVPAVHALVRRLPSSHHRACGPDQSQNRIEDAAGSAQFAGPERRDSGNIGLVGVIISSFQPLRLDSFQSPTKHRMVRAPLRVAACCGPRRG